MSNNVFVQLYRGYFGVNHVGSSFKEGFEIGINMPKDDPDYEPSFPISEHNVWPLKRVEDSALYEKRMTQYHSLLQGNSKWLLYILKDIFYCHILQL